MKRKLWLFISLSAMAFIVPAISMSAGAKSIPFTFSKPTQIEVNDLKGRGVLAVYVNENSFDTKSDPVTMTCGDGTEGSIKVFPGETRYCAIIHNKVSVVLLSQDFKNGTSGQVFRYSFE